MCWCIWRGGGALFQGALLQRSPAVRGARYLPEGGQCLQAGAAQEVFYHDYRPFPGEAGQISPSDKMRHAAGMCKKNIVLSVVTSTTVIGGGMFSFVHTFYLFYGYECCNCLDSVVRVVRWLRG